MSYRYDHSDIHLCDPSKKIKERLSDITQKALANYTEKFAGEKKCKSYAKSAPKKAMNNVLLKKVAIERMKNEAIANHNKKKHGTDAIFHGKINQLAFVELSQKVRDGAAYNELCEKDERKNFEKEKIYDESTQSLDDEGQFLTPQEKTKLDAYFTKRQKNLYGERYLNMRRAQILTDFNRLNMSDKKSTNLPTDQNYEEQIDFDYSKIQEKWQRDKKKMMQETGRLSKRALYQKANFDKKMESLTKKSHEKSDGDDSDKGTTKNPSTLIQKKERQLEKLLSKMVSENLSTDDCQKINKTQGNKWCFDPKYSLEDLQSLNMQLTNNIDPEDQTKRSQIKQYLEKSGIITLLRLVPELVALLKKSDPQDKWNFLTNIRKLRKKLHKNSINDHVIKTTKLEEVPEKVKIMDNVSKFVINLISKDEENLDKKQKDQENVSEFKKTQENISSRSIMQIIEVSKGSVKKILKGNQKSPKEYKNLVTDSKYSKISKNYTHGSQKSQISRSFLAEIKSEDDSDSSFNNSAKSYDMLNTDFMRVDENHVKSIRFVALKDSFDIVPNEWAPNEENDAHDERSASQKEFYNIMKKLSQFLIVDPTDANFGKKTNLRRAKKITEEKVDSLNKNVTLPQFGTSKKTPQKPKINIELQNEYITNYNEMSSYVQKKQKEDKEGFLSHFEAPKIPQEFLDLQQNMAGLKLVKTGSKSILQLTKDKLKQMRSTDKPSNSFCSKSFNKLSFHNTDKKRETTSKNQQFMGQDPKKGVTPKKENHFSNRMKHIHISMGSQSSINEQSIKGSLSKKNIQKDLSQISEVSKQSPEKHIFSLIKKEDSVIYEASKSNFKKIGKSKAHGKLKHTIQNNCKQLLPRYTSLDNDAIYETNNQTDNKDDTTFLNKSHSATLDSTYLNDIYDLFQKNRIPTNTNLVNRKSPTFNPESKNSSNFTNHKKFLFNSQVNHNMTADIKLGNKKVGLYGMPRQYSLSKQNSESMTKSKVNLSKLENQKQLISSFENIKSTNNLMLSHNRSTSNVFDYKTASIDKFESFKQKSLLAMPKINSNSQLPLLKPEKSYKNLDINTGYGLFAGDNDKNFGLEATKDKNLAKTYANMMINSSQSALNTMKVSSQDKTWANNIFTKKTDQWLEASSVKFL